MQQARMEFGRDLQTVAFRSLSVPVIANVSALPYAESGIARCLEEQVTASVQWVKSVEYLLDQGATEFEEIGPGNVLTNLVAKIRARPHPSAAPKPIPSPVPENDRTNHQGFKAAVALAVTADRLGSAAFRHEYGLRRAYVAGGMYKGIASVELVARMANAGYLAFFGTGGLANSVIEAAILDIRMRVGRRTFGMNLLCNLSHSAKEFELVELFMRHGIDVIEAAAFMQITPALVYYRVKGLAQTGGVVKARHRIIAKISRPEVAQQFLDPAPKRTVEKLLAQGRITREEALLAEKLPMADDLIVEADSAGHTDMGVASVLVPSIVRLSDRICGEAGYAMRVRVGAAGGIGSPEAAASAFMLGADFIVTGSINQCTPQAATSDAVKALLQDANIYDTDYAPAGDMFELGARIQVLKRGGFFPARANKLYDLWRRYDSLDDLDEKTARQIQDSYFKRSFSEVYEETRAYYSKVLPEQIEKAEIDAKHKMALIFRWYFIHSMRLAMTGSEAQRVDYQVHCGPSMGAFNQWVKGTELEQWSNRHVDVIADRLMEGTAAYLSQRVASLLQPVSEPVSQPDPRTAVTEAAHAAKRAVA
jgi:trans-AT polyketide synthase/acyltransferase/oxidoreductase domain-containing protein